MLFHSGVDISGQTPRREKEQEEEEIEEDRKERKRFISSPTKAEKKNIAQLGLFTLAGHREINLEYITINLFSCYIPAG